MLINKLRNFLFVKSNGSEGIQIPGSDYSIEDFKYLYSHPAASGRSYGASLSDLFWYWLAPGPEFHQEHVENGMMYDEISTSTKGILSSLKLEFIGKLELLLLKHMDQAIAGEFNIVRLRDVFMPMWAEFYYELVFEDECTEEARRLIVTHANDVIQSLKHLKLRSMKNRLELTGLLEEKIKSGKVKHELPSCLGTEQQAFFLQGLFFNTAIVQMSEALSHVLFSLAENVEIQKKLSENLDNSALVQSIINESYRLHPLFGIAHRITKDEIELSGGRKIAKGSVLCFDYKAFHHFGLKDPETFNPFRTDFDRSKQFMPFGMATNRPCPAQAIVTKTMMASLRVLLKKYTFESNAHHDRSLLNRAPCLISKREFKVPKFKRIFILRALKIRDFYELNYYSLVQIILGPLMILDARRKQISTNFFKEKIGV